MKNQKTTITVTFILFVIITLLFVITNDVNAQASKVYVEKYELSNNAVNSLIMGIKSENPGLRKSAIFYAGQYRLNAAVDCLIEELQKEKDPSTKTLIALSLYKIGNPIAIEYIKDIAKYNNNTKIIDLFNAINNEFTFENSLTTAQK